MWSMDHACCQFHALCNHIIMAERGTIVTSHEWAVWAGDTDVIVKKEKGQSVFTRAPRLYAPGRLLFLRRLAGMHLTCGLL